MPTTDLSKQIELIVNSAHSDPFQILGIHPVKAKQNKCIAIRAFVPEAREVFVIDLRGEEGKPKALDVEDIPDWPEFIKQLANPDQPSIRKILGLLDNKTRDIITFGGRLTKPKKEAIISSLNKLPENKEAPQEDIQALNRFLKEITRSDPPPGTGKEYPMAKLHQDGFFEAVIENTGEVFPYQLRQVNLDGSSNTFYDPYSFLPVLSDFDLHLIGEGTHYKNYEKLGAHTMTLNDVSGVCFGVWAPNALRVSVMGNFNNWDGRRHPMRKRSGGGVWELFIPGLGEGEIYKFEVKSKFKGHIAEKADPYAFLTELRPQSASVVHDIKKYKWNDEKWMKERRTKNWLESPISTYEVHLGSWKRVREDNNRWLTYRELADTLIPYVMDMGYTHLQLLPISEHPLDESWGYQTIGYYSCTSRFGTPEDFMYFVDCCHQNGIGVIIDWVPAHFPKDSHGLGYFDGTELYEHKDPRQREHRDWGTLIFNYGRSEVANYLIANALFWLDRYHVDGLRVDAVASMLYLDYSRDPGDWIPNKYGGNENLEAVAFIKKFNEVVHENYPGALTIAEESTAWPMVSRPTHLGGLGFSMKWNMGWMHDTLVYFSKEPIHRKHHHDTLTFCLLYAFTENFINVLSHDEVVHGKGSMLDKMPGDPWQKFANLRLLHANMYAQPGKTLLFMGGEIGQWTEWDCSKSIEWDLLDHAPHKKLRYWVKDLNRLYKKEPALYEVDFDGKGFEWINHGDYEQSVIAFIRKAKDPDDFLLFVFNFTPVPRNNYRIWVPKEGFYKEMLNSDAEIYGGSNVGNYPGVQAEPREWQGKPWSVNLTLPPLGALVFKLLDRKDIPDL